MQAWWLKRRWNFLFAFSLLLFSGINIELGRQKEREREGLGVREQSPFEFWVYVCMPKSLLSSRPAQLAAAHFRVRFGVGGMGRRCYQNYWSAHSAKRIHLLRVGECASTSYPPLLLDGASLAVSWSEQVHRTPEWSRKTCHHHHQREINLNGHEAVCWALLPQRFLLL